MICFNAATFPHDLKFCIELIPYGEYLSLNLSDPEKNEKREREERKQERGKDREGELVLAVGVTSFGVLTNHFTAQIKCRSNLISP